MTALVDVLCHLDDPRLVDRRAALARASSAGVSDVISAGVHPAEDAVDVSDDDETSGIDEAAGGRDMPPKRPRIWRAFGLHPREAPTSHAELDEILAVLERRLDAPDVVALGECGLDKRPGMPPIASQERALAAQLDLARRRGLPVILHCVRAPGRLLGLVAQGGPLEAGGMLHGYSGAPDVIEALTALNLSLSYGGILTNPWAKRARASARRTPSAHLLVETDAPETDPGALPLHLRALADLREEPLDAVAEATADNARRLFNLPKPGPRLAAGSASQSP